MQLFLDAHERLVTFFASLLIAACVVGFSISTAKADETKKLVVFGDSLVAGYGLGPGEGFTEQLGKALVGKGHRVEVINAGVSGDTTTGGLARFDWSVGPDADAIILELGANDALRGISPQITRKNLAALAEKMKKRAVPVLVAGMLAPPNMGSDYGNAFNAIYPDIATENGFFLYPFFLDGVAAEESLNQADGIHPNAKGVQLIISRILPFVEKLLIETKG